MKKLTWATVLVLLMGLMIWTYAFFHLPESVPLSVNNVTLEEQEKTDPVNTELLEPEIKVVENTSEEKQELKEPEPENVLKSGDDLILAKETFTPGNDSGKPLVREAKELIGDYRIKEALDVFRQADTQESDQVTQYYLGILSAYLGQREQAQEYLKQAIESNTHPKTTAYAQSFLDIYSYFASFQDAKIEFLDALICKELLAAGEFEIAIDKLRYITTAHPDYVDAWVLLGSAYLIQGKYDKATTALNEVLPTDRGEVYYWLGLAYYYQDDLNKSVSAYNQALRKGYQPRYRLYEKIGDIYLDENNYQKAAEQYSKALEEEEAKGYIDLYIRPVWLYNDVLNEPYQALYLAQQALLYHPEHAMAHNLVGWTYLTLEDYEQAKTHLKQAKQIDPNLPAAYLNLGRYFEAIGEDELAIQNYEDAYRLDPEGAVGESAEKRRLGLGDSSKGSLEV